MQITERNTESCQRARQPSERMSLGGQQFMEAVT